MANLANTGCFSPFCEDYMGKLIATVAIAMMAGTALFVSISPATASADTLEALCKVGSPGPEADKVCKCTSDKISAADRPAAIAAMTAVNAAMTKGTVLDPTTLPPDLSKGMAVVMEAQVQCM